MKSIWNLSRKKIVNTLFKIKIPLNDSSYHYFFFFRISLQQILHTWKTFTTTTKLRLFDFQNSLLLFSHPNKKKTRTFLISCCDKKRHARTNSLATNFVHMRLLIRNFLLSSHMICVFI